VLGHLELVSSKMLSQYPKQLTSLVGQQHGVYALYKGKRLYYVGLATNLRNRIKHHLRDKHAGRWDKFSLYLVRKADHIRELESLIMRIASPAGNAATGRLPRSENLRHMLKSEIKNAQDKQLQSLMGIPRARKKAIKSKTNRKHVTRSDNKKKAPSGRKPSLGPFVDSAFRLKATHKGHIYHARVRKDGRINFDGNLYASPSLAGVAATGKPKNDWTFWKYRNSNKEWVPLNKLREKE